MHTHTHTKFPRYGRERELGGRLLAPWHSAACMWKPQEKQTVAPCGVHALAYRPLGNCHVATST